jgi:hypothetical protein
VIESPFAGDTEVNLAYARLALADSLTRGEAPLASHLLYTQILDDAEPEQRMLGIDAGLAWHAVTEAVILYLDRGMSPGMQAAVANAELRGIPVERRYLGPDGRMADLIEQDQRDHPRGHPCRDCGRYFYEHPAVPTDAEPGCEAWR